MAANPSGASGVDGRAADPASPPVAFDARPDHNFPVAMARGSNEEDVPDDPVGTWPDAAVRHVLDKLGDACVAVDESGRIIYANPAADTLLGWPSGGLEGEPASAVVPPVLRNWHPDAEGSAPIMATLAQLAGRPLRVSTLRHDGSEIPTDLILSIITGPHAPVLLATIRNRDVGHLTRWSRLTATLFDTLGAADSDRSPDTQLVEVLGTQLGFEMATLWALTDDGEPYCRAVWTDPDRDPEHRLWAARSPDSWVGVNLPQHVLGTGEPLWVPVLAEDARFARGPAARAGLTTAVAFPVRYGGTIVGVVELLSTEQKPGDPGLVDLVRAVSRPVGELLVALRQSSERERLLRDLEAARQRQDFVLLASRVVSQMSDYETTLQRLGEVAVPVLGDLCLIDVVEEGGTFARMVCHHHDPGMADLCDELRHRYPPDPASNHPSIAAAADRRSRWSADMTDEFLRETTIDDRHYEVVKALGFTSFMAVPLIAGDRVLGTVTLVSAGSGRRFDEHDLEWAEQLASQVASVVDRARLHQREHEISHTLQNSLLPERLPDIPGIALGARYLPASLAEVGGDWYDVIVTDQRVSLVVGDVEGHDMRAASIMGKLRHALALLLSEDLAPSTALDRLNAFALRSDTGRLATVLVVALDHQAGALRIASAGHLPPVIRSDGRTELVDLAPAPPIGVPHDGAREIRLAMGHGDVVLFTDGLVERAAFDTADRLGQLLAAVADGPGTPSGLCDHVIRSLLPGADRSDDVALLVATTTRPDPPI
jgi:PAS domain S-box-containing protein